MKDSEDLKKILPGLAGSIQPGDGLDPRFDRRKSEHGRRNAGHKADQLCAQVRRTLELAVPEAMAGSKYDVLVTDVQPAPNTSNLLVLVQSASHIKELSELPIVQAELNRRTSFLRTIVAQSINRGKAPNLVFRIIPS